LSEIFPVNCIRDSYHQLNLTNLNLEFLKSDMEVQKGKKHKRKVYLTFKFSFHQVQLKYAFRIRPFFWLKLNYSVLNCIKSWVAEPVLKF